MCVFYSYSLYHYKKTSSNGKYQKVHGRLVILGELVCIVQVSVRRGLSLKCVTLTSQNPQNLLTDFRNTLRSKHNTCDCHLNPVSNEQQRSVWYGTAHVYFHFDCQKVGVVPK